MVSGKDEILLALAELVARARAHDPSLLRELRAELDRLLADSAVLETVRGDEWHGLLGTSPAYADTCLDEANRWGSSR